MLFRGQIPLALTSLVSPSDPRVLSIFECHAPTESGLCSEGVVLVTRVDGAPRQPPAPDRYNLVVESLGPDSEAVSRVVAAFVGVPESANDNHVPKTQAPPPLVIMSNVTDPIGRSALAMVQQLGAQGHLTPAAPTTLPPRLGRLVPFDDGTSSRKTTLAPLIALSEQLGRKSIRGLIGGATPGYRDFGSVCPCGRPMKTAVRLLADDAMQPVALQPAVAQFCTSCGIATLLRTG